MQPDASLKHWDSWARTYGSELRATTKCETIKLLEIEAFVRWIDRIGSVDEPLVCELGCGNGINGFALTERRPGLNYVGLDFSDAMVDNAIQIARRHVQEGTGSTARVAFGVADGRELRSPLELDRSRPHHAGTAVRPLLPVPGFDVVITDRMLINLSSAEEQLEVMRRIAELVKPGGHFLMLENSAQTHAALNGVRIALGLPERRPAEFNVFIDEPGVIDPFTVDMELLAVDDFAAVHDLMLYAVAPAAGGGVVEYDTAAMRKLTEALVELDRAGVQRSGTYGQNRLWVWQRR